MYWKRARAAGQLGDTSIHSDTSQGRQARACSDQGSPRAPTAEPGLAGSMAGADTQHQGSLGGVSCSSFQTARAGDTSPGSWEMHLGTPEVLQW